MWVVERWSKFDSSSPSEVIGVFETEDLAEQGIVLDKNKPSFAAFNYEKQRFNLNVLKED